MSDKHLDPARTIISYLGGVPAVCEITETHISNVYRWMAPRGDRRGTGGKIPYDSAEKMLAFAKVKGLDLRGDDFFDAARLQAVMAEKGEVEGEAA